MPDSVVRDETSVVQKVISVVCWLGASNRLRLVLNYKNIALLDTEELDCGCSYVDISNILFSQS